MKKIRIWLVGDRIGLPYEDYTLTNFSLFTNKEEVILVDKHDLDHFRVIPLKFVTKVEVF